MADLESMLQRWTAAGVLDDEAAARIRTFEVLPEAARSRGLRWQSLIALILGALLLGCGVILFVSVHWDQLGTGARFLLVLAMVSLFHLAGGWTRASYKSLSTALHAVGTLSTGAAITLVGQIFNIQEHWPAAILLWALAAWAGWALLHDEAQQTLAILLTPAWILSELAYRSQWKIGQDVYLGRFCVLWGMLYLILFLHAKRRLAAGLLNTAATLALLVGSCMMLEGWATYSSEQSFLPFGLRVWFWLAMGLLPFGLATFKGRKGLIPMAATLAYALALPCCQHVWMQSFNGHYTGSYTRTEPSLMAHALVAGFAVFLCWWGVRVGSRWLVNLGVVGFALAVGWFYYSNLFDAFGRSLGLIGLGILFLVGGWALEKLRRGLLAHMNEPVKGTEEAL
ncbi:DUF2157 domain-containing protein [Telmatobacter bradus]|uniref:DUF2157 domain-containing protein n=1 Tax=Telmatobacter bradus TaxID=474953 RepID=UPI003B428CA7